MWVFACWRLRLWLIERFFVSAAQLPAVCQNVIASLALLEERAVTSTVAPFNIFVSADLIVCNREASPRWVCYKVFLKIRQCCRTLMFFLVFTSIAPVEALLPNCGQRVQRWQLLLKWCRRAWRLFNIWVGYIWEHVSIRRGMRGMRNVSWEVMNTAEKSTERE